MFYWKNNTIMKRAGLLPLLNNGVKLLVLLLLIQWFRALKIVLHLISVLLLETVRS